MDQPDGTESAFVALLGDLPGQSTMAVDRHFIVHSHTGQCLQQPALRGRESVDVFGLAPDAALRARMAVDLSGANNHEKMPTGTDQSTAVRLRLHP